MNTKNDNIQEMIMATKKRLQWFIYEATEEEFDAEEVDYLIGLLNKWEPIEDNRTDEEILEAFYQYAEMREAEMGNGTVAGDAENTSVQGNAKVLVDGGKKKLESGSITKLRKYVTVAAAVLVVILIAGGSFQAVVNANQGNGFFYWLKKDDEGVTMITSPEKKDESLESEYVTEYQSVEEMPEEYAQYLFDIEEVEQLQDYEVEYITVVEGEFYKRVRICFVNNVCEKNIIVGAFIYEDKAALHRATYLAASVQGEENILEEGVLIRNNPEGDAENQIFFYIDNVKFYIEGNAENEEILKIAEVYLSLKCFENK